MNEFSWMGRWLCLAGASGNYIGAVARNGKGGRHVRAAALLKMA